MSDNEPVIVGSLDEIRQIVHTKVEGWFARYQELVNQYRSLGMTADDADDMATRVVRREIRASRQ